MNPIWVTRINIKPIKEHSFFIIFSGSRTDASSIDFFYEKLNCIPWNLVKYHSEIFPTIEKTILSLNKSIMIAYTTESMQKIWFFSLHFHVSCNAFLQVLFQRTAKIMVDHHSLKFLRFISDRSNYWRNINTDIKTEKTKPNLFN